MIQPGARGVDARAAVALPLPDADGVVHTVVGFAFEDERPLMEAELAELTELARKIAAG